MLLQCAERFIRYLTRKPNNRHPWALWAHEELLPRLAEFKEEFTRIVKVQAKIKATQKTAGERGAAAAAAAAAAVCACLSHCGL
jgi:hypothetical protein